METKRGKTVFMDSFFSDYPTGGRWGENGKEVLAISIFPWLVLVIICSSVWAAGGDMGHGDGTPENPYLIEDLADFDVFSDQNNVSTYWTDGVHTRLMTDIDLSERTYITAVIASIQYYWDPHSQTYVREGVPFSGVFDGNGNAVRNIIINSAGKLKNYLGLFGQINGSNAEIVNLGVEGITITEGDLMYVGGLVGENVSGCLMDCYAHVSISACGEAGGIAGVSSGLISDCYSTGSVAGAFIIGGLVGLNNGIITNCYSNCSVSSDSNCSVFAPGDYGGLVGYNRGSIQSSFSASSLSEIVSFRGLCGYQKGDSAEMTNCFWDIETSGQSFGYTLDSTRPGTVTNVLGKTTAEMKIQTTFTEYGWDFVGEEENGVNEIWRICEDEADYPRLSWEYGRHGDFTCPEGVELKDLEAMASGWLTDDSSSDFNYACDGSRDGFIGQADFALLAQNWLIPYVSDPLLILSKFQFLLSITEEQTEPILQTLTIENAGIGVLEWTIETNEPMPNCLLIDPLSGSLQRGEGEPVTLTISTAALSPGFYEYSFEVTDPNAENRPQTVTVKLHIITPAAYWALDETEGITAYDSSGNGHHGTLVNFDDPNSSWTAGKIGNCLLFDGSNDYAEAGEYMGITGTQPRTTCAWIKLSSIGSGGTILSYGSSDYRGSWLFMVNGDNKLQLGVNEGNIIGTRVLGINRWYHVAAVLEDRDRDGLTVDDLRLYIDGEEVPGNYKNPDKEIVTGSVYPVRIGMHVSVSYFFNGLIDEVRMYEAALSEEQIALLATDPPF